LIPGGKGCFVLITSRRSLAGLDGVALRLELDTLTDADALALLVRWIGEKRFAAEPEAATHVVRLCGNLPLAVRIAGGQLRLRPALLQQYSAELENADRRLEILQLDDRAVRASFMLSYQSLSPWEARLFRLLGLFHGESFSPQAAVALDGGREEHVWKVLGHLVDAQLIGLSGTRYSIHDLMHLLARERLAEEKAEDQESARRRLAGWLADESRKMSVWLSPDTRAKKIKELAQAGIHIERKDTNNFFNALNWFELEKGNLLNSVEYAYRIGEWELTWQLAINSAVFYNLRSHWADWERTHVLALDAARRKADEGAEGVVLNLLGNVYRHQGRWEQAAGIFRQSLDLNRKLGNIMGESIALNLLANVHRLQGRWEEACSEFKEALDLNIRHDNPHGMAIALGGLGNVYRMAGRWEEALQAYEECLKISEKLDDSHGRTINLNMKGQVLTRLGRLKEAETALNESLRLSREMKSSKGECIALRILGEMDMTRLDWEAAYENLTSSLRIARQNNDKRCSSQTLILLGEWHTERENWDEAETCFADARSILRSMDDRHDEGLVLQSLGWLRFEQGRDDEANSICREALMYLNTSSPEYAEVQAWLEKSTGHHKKRRFFLQV
jgi:tetratricopeptide (TPR) repeat protein